MKFRRFSALLLAFLLAALCCVPAGAAAAPERTATILFTHFLPQPTAEGGESGGYARLKTVIDQERAAHPDALLVDGGDFSIGSLIQTLYTTQAAELRTMGALPVVMIFFISLISAFPYTAGFPPRPAPGSRWDSPSPYARRNPAPCPRR